MVVVGDAHSEATARYAVERIGAPSLRWTSARALQEARARQVLRRLPMLYTESRFDACAEEVGRAERELAVRLPRQAVEELGLLKQLNFWNGVCRAGAGADRSASRAFALAAQLPGPTPERELFPPATWQLYRRAQEPSRRRCPLQVPKGLRWVVLDGKQAAAGHRVLRGDHYAVWDAGEGERSDRVRLGAGCRLVLPPPPPEPAAAHHAALPQMAQEQADDEVFLADLGRAEGVPELLVIGVTGDEARVRLFAPVRSRWLMSSQAAIGPDQAAGEVLRGLIQQVLSTAPPIEEQAAPVEEQAPPPEPRPPPQARAEAPASEPRPAAEVAAATTARPAADAAAEPQEPPAPEEEPDRWWIWALVGGAAVVAAVAVAVPVVVFWPKEEQPDTDRRYELSF